MRTVLRSGSRDLPKMASGWTRRAWARAKSALGSEEAKARLEKLESAVELEVLDRRRAEVDKTTSETISNLIAAVEDTEEAVIRLGSVIVVKHDGRIWAERVDELTARQLDSNPAILNRPQEVAQFFGRTGAAAGGNQDHVDGPEGLPSPHDRSQDEQS